MGTLTEMKAAAWYFQQDLVKNNKSIPQQTTSDINAW